ncbi:hypothetical protein Goklo_001223 [Gossypium klotzschianum]|uniref:Uncharacterized protein n=1 Tax=Gossypium klotzschianum TaxID=34286 RepID=A0A7J8W0A7_9ROSI|nr:hypothetical protein [Gossypium klotzschianum]
MGMSLGCVVGLTTQACDTCTFEKILRFREKFSEYPKVEKVSYLVFSEEYSPLKEFIIRDEILYRCGDFDWVPLLGIWGVVGYAPLLVLRQYRSRQFIPATIEKLEEEKIQQGLDVNVQNLEAEKMRKGKNKTEEDLDNLKIDYKKLCLSIRTTELDARVREDALKRDFLENQDEKVGLRAWVAKLKRSLHQHRSCNSVIELKASLTKIKELKRKIEELEATLQNYELRVELLEMNNEHWKELLQRSQGQIKDRDHIMCEALTQARKVADPLQTLAKHNKPVDPVIGRRDQKRESTMVNSRDDNEDTTYPLGFTPMNVQAQSDAYLRRVPVTIRPQQYQAGTSRPVNYPMGLGSNPRDNPTNLVVLDLDDMAEVERARVELPK